MKRRVIQLAIISAVIAAAVLVNNWRLAQEISSRRAPQLPEKAWSVFSPAWGDFQVLMPEKPDVQHVEMTVDGAPVVLTLYTSSDSLTSYSVGYFHYPETTLKQSTPEDLLAASRSNLLATQGSPPLVDERGVFYGHPGRQMAFENTQKEQRIGVRFFIAGSRCFQLVYTAYLPAMNQSKVDQFFSSFQTTSTKPSNGRQ